MAISMDGVPDEIELLVALMTNDTDRLLCVAHYIVSQRASLTDSVRQELLDALSADIMAQVITTVDDIFAAIDGRQC